jgi:hypothetical protein
MDKDKVLNGQQVIEEAMSTLPPPRVIVVSLIGVDGCCVDEGLERMLGRSSIWWLEIPTRFVFPSASCTILMENQVAQMVTVMYLLYGGMYQYKSDFRV